MQLTTSTVYAINPDGTQKWTFASSFGVYSSPTIGADGTIYVGSLPGLVGPFPGLVAINPDGTQKWTFATGREVCGSAAIGADGTIFVGSYDGKLYAINPDGTQRWTFTTGSNVFSLPAIGADGTVYVGSDDGKLYAVYSSSGGLANSPWPMFHHDVRHTGQSNYIGLNIPKPTATPPIETFPQPAKLFVDSGTFIKNNSDAFSPDSQRLFKDNQNALDRFTSKFITSEDGFKATANLGKSAFSWLGTGLGALSVHDTPSFLLFAGKQVWNPILDQNNDWQTRWLIDGLTAGGSLLTSPIIYAPLTLGGLFCTAYTNMFDLIADDPPDSNFTEVYQCPVANFSPFNLPGVSQEMNRLVGLQFGSSYNTYYYLLGLTTSINRYSSALAAGDAVSAGLQFEAFVKYLTLYDTSAIQTADYINRLKQGLITQGMPDVSYSKQELLNLQNQIRENGLPPEVITSFKNLGFTDSQISDLTEAALNYVPPDSVTGSLYSNLANGTGLLHDVSSWRPFNPAILYLLLND